MFFLITIAEDVSQSIAISWKGQHSSASEPGSENSSISEKSSSKEEKKIPALYQEEWGHDSTPGLAGAELELRTITMVVHSPTGQERLERS